MTPEKPVTEREAVERQRIAFRQGWNCATEDAKLCHTRASARETNMEARYPLPPRLRPLRVTLSDGSAWSKLGESDDIFANGEGDACVFSYMRQHAKTADDFRLIARLLDGEVEPIPEDEDDA